MARRAIAVGGLVQGVGFRPFIFGLASRLGLHGFVRNQTDGDTFVKVRGEFFKSRFPASMLITAKDFANPDLLVEIQSVGVIGDTLR